MSTYTLGADGTYTDSRTGGTFTLKAGAVFQNADAVALGLPGATPDAATNPFPAQEATWLDSNVGGGASTLAELSDVDLDNAAEGAALVFDGTLFSASGNANLIENGDFSANITGWYTLDPNSTVVWDNGTHNVGYGGCLAVDCSADGARAGAIYSPDPDFNAGIPVTDGQVLMFSFIADSDSTSDIEIQFQYVDGHNYVIGSATVEDFTCCSFITVVPAGSGSVWPAIRTRTAQDTTFYIDKVRLTSLGVIPA